MTSSYHHSSITGMAMTISATKLLQMPTARPSIFHLSSFLISHLSWLFRGPPIHDRPTHSFPHCTLHLSLAMATPCSAKAFASCAFSGTDRGRRSITSTLQCTFLCKRLREFHPGAPSSYRCEFNAASHTEKWISKYSRLFEKLSIKHWTHETIDIFSSISTKKRATDKQQMPLHGWWTPSHLHKSLEDIHPTIGIGSPKRIALTAIHCSALPLTMHYLQRDFGLSENRVCSKFTCGALGCVICPFKIPTYPNQWHTLPWLSFRRGLHWPSLSLRD